MTRASHVAEKLFAEETENRVPPRTGKKTPVSPGRPEVQQNGQEYIFTWPQLGIGVGITALREMNSGIECEITVESSVLGNQHWSRINLASISAREALSKKLLGRAGGVNWSHILDVVASYVAEARRTLNPVKLTGQVLAEERLLLDPLLPRGESTVICADGGSGKSMLALAVGISVASSHEVAGIFKPVEKCSVIYLDWETTERETNSRMGQICQGLKIRVPDNIHYLSMSRGLADDIRTLQAEIEKLKIGLLIIDSIAPACGAEPESADSIIRVMNSLKSLSCTKLIVAHVSKASADQNTPSRPYGSVFLWNLARSVWEVKKAHDEEDDVLPLGLFHRKSNYGRLHAPIGIRFEFEPWGISIEPHDPMKREEFQGHLSLSRRIQAALREGSLTTTEVAERVTCSPDSAGRILRRLRENGKIINFPRGKDKAWGFPVNENL